MTILFKEGSIGWEGALDDAVIRYRDLRLVGLTDRKIENAMVEKAVHISAADWPRFFDQVKRHFEFRY